MSKQGQCKIETEDRREVGAMGGLASPPPSNRLQRSTFLLTHEIYNKVD